MPSDQSTWLISVPESGDAEGLFHELSSKLNSSSKSGQPSNLAQLSIPSFKVNAHRTESDIMPMKLMHCNKDRNLGLTHRPV